MSATDQSQYDVLGISPRASRQQIDRAYRFLCELYGEGALATYSLLEAEETEATRSRVREAYQILVDPVRRRAYDVEHGYAGADDRLLPFEKTQTETEAASPTSPEQAHPRASPEVLPEPLTGADLRRVREEKGVSLEEIASMSKVGIRHLKYIEADRHASLPAAVYLRGFVQEYARAVGLDPKQTAKSYLAHLRSSQASSS